MLQKQHSSVLETFPSYGNQKATAIPFSLLLYLFSFALNGGGHIFLSPSSPLSSLLCSLVSSSPTLQTLQTLPLPRPLASVRFDPPACRAGLTSAGSVAAGSDGCLLGRIHFPCGYVCLWCMCFCVLRCFSCSHTVLPKEHSLGVIFFSSLSLCLCCIFLQFYVHFTTDYTCMIVYVTNNKEPWF